MGLYITKPVVASSVPTADVSELNTFIDIADNVWKAKDENGNTLLLTPAIAVNSVTNALMAQMPTLTIKGNNTGGTANVIDLTVAQATAMLDTFTSLLKGLVPASGGGVVNFLRADGTWANPLPLVNEVVLTNSINNNLTTPTVITGMTLTPPTGTYKVNFSADVNSDSNNRNHVFGIYLNGVLVGGTTRRANTDAGKHRIVSITSPRLTLNGTDTVDVRWQISAGTQLMSDRILTLTQCK